ncbi:MAG: hypothetical protein ACI4QD_02260 [Kiritimatiellia bacterium]
MKIQLTLNPEYAIRWTAVALLMVAISIWSVYDGKVSYPRMNRQLEKIAPLLGEAGMTPSRLLEIDGRQRRIDAIYSQNLGIRKAPRRLVGRITDLAKQAEKAKATVKPGHNSDFILEQNRILREKILAQPLWSPHDIRSQYIMALATLLLGLLAAATLVYRRVRAGCLDGNTFRGFGAPFRFDDIAQTDETEWKRKGILKLRLKDNRIITLDAWHYNGVKEIHRRLQA